MIHKSIWKIAAKVMRTYRSQREAQLTESTCRWLCNCVLGVVKFACRPVFTVASFYKVTAFWLTRSFRKFIDHYLSLLMCVNTSSQWLNVHRICWWQVHIPCRWRINRSLVPRTTQNGVKITIIGQIVTTVRAGIIRLISKDQQNACTLFCKYYFSIVELISQAPPPKTPKPRKRKRRHTK